MCLNGGNWQWPVRLDDQVHRLVELHRDVTTLSRRLGPGERRLVVQLVSMHDRLWSLTEALKRRLAEQAPTCTGRPVAPQLVSEELRCRATMVANMSSTGTQTDPCDHMFDWYNGDEQTAGSAVDEEHEYALCEWRPPSCGPGEGQQQEQKQQQRFCDATQYTELCLKRSHRDQKIGLTLCYSSACDDDSETEIFISEIKPGSVADRDGRVRTGDQVLEINGVNVRSRSQAVDLFRQQREEVKMLIARRIAKSSYAHILFPPIREEEEEDDETDPTSAHEEKDSGISKTTTTDSDLELMPSLASPSKSSEASTDGSHSSGLHTSSSLPEDYEAGSLQACPVKMVKSTAAERGSGFRAVRLDEELEYLHREMEVIQRECDRLIEQHSKAERIMNRQLRDACILVSSLDQLQLDEGAPGRAATLEVSKLVTDNNSDTAAGSDLLRWRHLDRKKTCAEAAVEEDGKRDSAFFTLPGSQNNGPKNPSSTNNKNSKQGSSSSKKKKKKEPAQPSKADCPTAVESEEHIYASISGDTVYTTLENLQSTIALQQKNLRRIINVRPPRAVPPPSVQNSPTPARSRRPTEEKRSEKESVKMEWKVKRRSDGTRYITRRPVRKQVLKDRAERLANERFGCSTDDDAVSELKVGRYWSKEERRQHWEKCKERKRRQEEVLRRKAERPAATDQQILQLSYKKMLRRQGQQLLDRFTTIQEFLAHGNRTAENYRALGLISVTTV